MCDWLTVLLFYGFSACKPLMCFNGKTCMIENGIGVCRCLFNCSSQENTVKRYTTEKIMFGNVSFCSRYVDQMESSIEIYVNWNVIVVFVKRILYRSIIPTVSYTRLFAWSTKISFFPLCPFYFWLIVNITSSNVWLQNKVWERTEINEMRETRTDN